MQTLPQLLPPAEIGTAYSIQIMQTLAFVDDKFYIEFVINVTENIAYITKRAFKGVKFNDQSTSMTVDAARRYWSKLHVT